MKAGGRRSRWPVGALVVAAGAGHVLYPACLALASRGRAPVSPGDPDPWPGLTVLVPAYGEAGVIGAKVADLRAQDYPGPLEILVVADGDPETARAAAGAGARVLAPPDRLGKAQGVNLGVGAASHDVVVLTDANNSLGPGSLRALARWFDDPGVAAVAGEKVEEDGGGESAYWRFESWLKQREVLAMGTTIGLVGELAAVRREAFRPIPPDVATDDLWTALDLAGRGLRIAYEPAARAAEPAAGTLGDQWERRTRSVSGALHLLAAHRTWQLGPAGGPVALQIWGHRLWRYTGGPLAHLALVLLALRAAGRSPTARAFLAGHLLALALLGARARGRSLPGPLAFGPQVLLLQGVALGGLLRYLRGDRRVRWPTVTR